MASNLNGVYGNESDDYGSGELYVIVELQKAKGYSRDAVQPSGQLYLSILLRRLSSMS